MPAAMTHYIHATKVLEELKSKGVVSETDETAYFWGCQGPDFIFTHRFLPWMKGENIRHLAEGIHMADPNKTLLAMIKYVGEERSVTTASYLLGFICHYSLDSTAHPYINFLADELLEDEQGQSKGVFHTEVESALDVIMFRSENSELPSDINLGMYYPQNEAIQREIASIYTYLFKEVLGEEINHDLIYEATCDANKVFSLLSDKTGIKNTLVRIFEKGRKRNVSAHFRPIMENDFDYANLTKTPWRDYYGKECKDSFLELLMTAKEKAIEIIGGFQTENIEQLTKNEPFC